MMHRIFAPAVFALALAGCQQAGEPATQPTPPVESGIIASAAELEGEYRIAGVGEQDINLPHGISAIITADRIEVSADCIRLAWSYRFDGGTLTTDRQPAASCRRALFPEEEAVAAAFDSAENVRRTQSNGVEFSGGGQSVTLFSQ